MLNKDYKMYAFDLDGTLVDTRADIALTLRAILLDAGRGCLSASLSNR